MDEILQLILFPVVVGLSIIGAQAVAVWFKNWWNSPKLELEINDFYPYETSGIKTYETFDDERIHGDILSKLKTGEIPVNCLYYHLILENKGRAMAKNVIVKIVIFDENRNVLDKISQLKLEQRGFVPTDVAANSSEIFDLCYIDDSNKTNLIFTSLVGLQSRKRQSSNPFGLGTYRIQVYVFADNFNQKKPYTFKVIRTEGFLENNVQISLISAP